MFLVGIMLVHFSAVGLANKSMARETGSRNARESISACCELAKGNEGTGWLMIHVSILIVPVCDLVFLSQLLIVLFHFIFISSFFL